MENYSRKQCNHNCHMALILAINLINLVLDNLTSKRARRVRLMGYISVLFGWYTAPFKEDLCSTMTSNLNILFCIK